jgi:hypothetical protein
VDGSPREERGRPLPVLAGVRGRPSGGRARRVPDPRKHDGPPGGGTAPTRPGRARGGAVGRRARRADRDPGRRRGRAALSALVDARAPRPVHDPRRAPSGHRRRARGRPGGDGL